MKKLIILLALFFIGCGGNSSNQIGGGSTSDGVFEGHMSEKVQATTPKGIHVYSDRTINQALLTEFDKGLDNLFRIAAAPPYNYSGFPMHNAYHIWIFPRSPLCENPAFLVNASGSPYEGSEWDKDPSPTRCLICAAGMMVRRGSPLGPQGEALPGQPGMVITDDVGIASTIVKYEGEHNLLLDVDMPKFAATQYHTGPNGGHPILPDPATGQLMSPHEFGATKNAQIAAEGAQRNILVVK